MKNQKIKLSRKRNLVTLSELKTFIIQPNRITNSIFEGFTLIQHKVLSAIMLNLQVAIQLEMKNKDYTQLNIFQNFDHSVRFNLSLKDITNDPTAYNAVRMAIFGMSQTHIAIPQVGDDGKRFHFAPSFITAMIPEVAEYKSFVPIKIEMIIAKFLIGLERNKFNCVNQFTKYQHEIVKTAASIYTIQIYKLICAWREQDYFSISYGELRRILSIDSKKYTRFSDFKRDVILVAQKELFEKGDNWFTLEEKNFKTLKKNIEGEKEIHLTFRIHNSKRIQAAMNRTDIVSMLRTHFNFNDESIKDIRHLLEDETIPSDIIRKKIIKIDEVIREKSKTDPVKNIRSYVMSSLIKHDWFRD